MGKQLAAILSALVVTCILVGIIGHLTGFNMGEMIADGFNSLKEAFKSIFGLT